MKRTVKYSILTSLVLAVFLFSSCEAKKGKGKSKEDIGKIIGFIKDLDPDIPLHITRFFPAGDMKDMGPTDLDILYDFRSMALESLNNVFLGNV